MRRLVDNYGLSARVVVCGSKARERIIPPKFSPEDKYAKYRRQAKSELEDGVK
jgi:rRNA maturation protein Nop10